LFNKLGSFNRRTFMQVAGGACIANAIRPALAESTSTGHLPLRMGVVVWVEEGKSIDDAVRDAHAMGFQTCQIGFERLTPAVLKPLKAALEKYEIKGTAFSEHGPGERVFDFYRGPKTIGIVPRPLREARINNLKMAADMAAACGIPHIHTHCGFTPEDPNHPLYPETVAAMKKIAIYCKDRGISFLCETGEETPITLRRMIEDVGTGNVFVNFDPANIVMCGKGNPVDAMEVLGPLVRGTHAKDGFLPTSTRQFGEEVAIGKGKVDFPTIFKQLRQANYQGPITIEREIDGPERIKDILQSKAYLEDLLRKTYQ